MALRSEGWSLEYAVRVVETSLGVVVSEEDIEEVERKMSPFGQLEVFSNKTDLELITEYYVLRNAKYFNSELTSSNMFRPDIILWNADGVVIYRLEALEYKLKTLKVKEYDELLKMNILEIIEFNKKILKLIKKLSVIEKNK